MRKTEDERGRSYWDLVAELPGQVNVSITRPKAKRGFHLHWNKVDYWLVIAGEVCVVTIPDAQRGDDAWLAHVYAAGDFITIEPGIWHAYQNVGESDAIILYYETAKSGPERIDDAEMPLSSYIGWVE